MKIVTMNVQENFQIPAELEIGSRPRSPCLRADRSPGSSGESGRRTRFDDSCLSAKPQAACRCSQDAPTPAVALNHPVRFNRAPGSGRIFRQPAKFLLSHPSRMFVTQFQEASTASRRMKREASPAITSSSSRS